MCGSFGANKHKWRLPPLHRLPGGSARIQRARGGKVLLGFLRPDAGVLRCKHTALRRVPRVRSWYCPRCRWLVAPETSPTAPQTMSRRVFIAAISAALPIAHEEYRARRSVQQKRAQIISGDGGGGIAVTGGRDGSVTVVPATVRRAPDLQLPAHAPVELRLALWRMRQFPKAPRLWALCSVFWSPLAFLSS